jgi:hypothetical protein
MGEVSFKQVVNKMLVEQREGIANLNYLQVGLQLIVQLRRHS